MSNISFSVFVGRNAWALVVLANVEGQAPYIIRTLYSNTGHGLYRLLLLITFANILLAIAIASD